MNAILQLKLDSQKKQLHRKDYDLEYKENPLRGKDKNIITIINQEKSIKRSFGNQQNEEKCFQAEIENNQNKQNEKYQTLRAASRYFFNEEQLAEQDELNENLTDRDIDTNQLLVSEKDQVEQQSTQTQSLNTQIKSKPVSWYLDQVKSSVILSKQKKSSNAITLQELKAISQEGRKDQLTEDITTNHLQWNNYSQEFNLNSKRQSVTSIQTNDIPVSECVKQILYPREHQNCEDEEEDSDLEGDWVAIFKQKQNLEQDQYEEQQNYEGQRLEILNEKIDNDEEQLEEQMILKQIAKKAQQLLDPESLTIPLVKKGQSQSSQVSLTSVLSQLGMADKQIKISKETENNNVPLEAEEISENDDNDAEYEMVLQKKRKIYEEKLRIADSELQKGEFFEREGYVLECNIEEMRDNGNESSCELVFSQPELLVKDKLKKKKNQTGENKKSSARESQQSSFPQNIKPQQDDISTIFQVDHSKISLQKINKTKISQVLINNDLKSNQNSSDQDYFFKVSNTLSTLKLPQDCSSASIQSSTKFKKRFLLKGGEIIECIQPFSCIICLDQPKRLFGELKCSHRFCLDCIENWAKVTNQCPQCRQSFNFIARKDFKGRSDRLIPMISVQNKKQKVSERYNREQARQIQEQEYQRDNRNMNRPCYKCNRNSHQNLLLICDVCDDQFCHTFCDERIQSNIVPQGRWSCHSCRP